MSEFGRNFDRAQSRYDAMTPPDDGPDESFDDWWAKVLRRISASRPGLQPSQEDFRDDWSDGGCWEDTADSIIDAAQDVEADE